MPKSNYIDAFGIPPLFLVSFLFFFFFSASPCRLRRPSSSLFLCVLLMPLTSVPYSLSLNPFDILGTLSPLSMPLINFNSDRHGNSFSMVSLNEVKSTPCKNTHQILSQDSGLAAAPATLAATTTRTLASTIARALHGLCPLKIPHESSTNHIKNAHGRPSGPTHRPIHNCASLTRLW